MPGIRTILLVDDDPQVKGLLESTLRLKDYRVAAHSDPAAALGYLKSHTPDLILSDVDQPRVDGYEFFRRIRETTRAAYAPFVFLGSAWDPERVADIVDKGVVEFQRKPFTVDELLDRIERIFAGIERSTTATPRFDLEGRLEHLPFPDVVTLLVKQGLSGRLVLSLPAEPAEGTVIFTGGEVLHVEFGRLTGTAALMQLCLRTEGAFAFATGGEQVVPSLIFGESVLDALADATRLEGEGMLRRIDVANGPACRMFEALILDAAEVPVRPSTDPDADGFHPGEDAFEISKEMPGLRETFGEVESLDEDSGPVFEAEEASDSAYVRSNQLFPEEEILSQLPREGDAAWEDPTEVTTTSIVIPARQPSAPVESAFLDDEEEDGAAVSAVALVDDGAPGPVELLFNGLQAAMEAGSLTLELKEVQLSTRSGRCLASTIESQQRRDEVAAFTAQAIHFAEKSDRGRFAQLSASDLHLMVVELPQRRLLTCLFDKPKKAAPFLKRLWGCIDGIE